MYYDSLYGGVDKKSEDYDTEMEYITNKKMLLNIVYNLFAWKNLPNNLSSRFSFSSSGYEVGNSDSGT